jgi:hypothetical protein
MSSVLPQVPLLSIPSHSNIYTLAKHETLINDIFRSMF